MILSFFFVIILQRKIIFIWKKKIPNIVVYHVPMSHQHLIKWFIYIYFSFYFISVFSFFLLSRTIGFFFNIETPTPFTAADSHRVASHHPPTAAHANLVFAQIIKGESEQRPVWRTFMVTTVKHLFVAWLKLGSYGNASVFLLSIIKQSNIIVLARFFELARQPVHS